MNNYIEVVSFKDKITFGSYCDSVPTDFNIQINKQELPRVEYCRYIENMIYKSYTYHV